MKRLSSIITALCLALTMYTGVLIPANATERFTVNKLVTFGDSVIFGACMGGPNVQADAYGDQKVVDLLGQEFGLKRYTSTDTETQSRITPGFFRNVDTIILRNMEPNISSYKYGVLHGNPFR